MKKLVLIFVVCCMMVSVAWAEPPAPKEDWKLRALEAEVKVLTQEAQLNKAWEEIKVLQSWMAGKFMAEQKKVSAEAQKVLKEYRDSLKKEE